MHPRIKIDPLNFVLNYLPIINLRNNVWFYLLIVSVSEIISKDENAKIT